MWAGELATGNSVRWWPKEDGTEYDGTSALEEEGASIRHQRLVPATWLVWTRNQARRTQWLYYARLYGGMEQVSVTPLGVDPAAQIFEPASLPYNLIRSSTNTLTAKVAKSRPIPTYLPVNGQDRVNKRVRLLNQFVAGLFHKHKIHRKTKLQTRDATLYGTGLLMVQPDGRRISVEGLYPWEVYVDPVDARYGEPRSLYLIRYLDKDILRRRFRQHAERIESAPVLDEAFYPIQDVFAVTNRCTVVEAWHLRSGPGAKDGRHTICLLDDTLLDEQYDEDEYPIARLMKDEPLAGWWGLGIGDEMSGFQDEKNIMAERVQYAHRIVGGQMWLVPDISQSLDTDYNDEIGTVIRYGGGPAGKPEAVNPQPIHPQTYEYFRGLDPDAYGYSGISSMSAQSVKPPGVTAALALQTLDDIETDRFTLFERDYEDIHVDIARLMLKAVRKIANKYGDFRVFTANKGAGQEVLWTRDVDLEEDSYVVQAWPTSILPKSPANRLERVIQLSQEQIFDRAQVLSMMGVPDTDAEERRLLAPRAAGESQIAHMLEAEDPHAPEAYIPPDKYQDLSYSMTRAQQEYCLLQSDSLDKGTYSDPDIQARLTNLATYTSACEKLLNDAQQQAQVQAALAQASAGPTAGAAPIAPLAPMKVPATPSPFGAIGGDSSGAPPGSQPSGGPPSQ